MSLLPHRLPPSTKMEPPPPENNSKIFFRRFGASFFFLVQKDPICFYYFDLTATKTPPSSPKIDPGHEKFLKHFSDHLERIFSFFLYEMTSKTQSIFDISFKTGQRYLTLYSKQVLLTGCCYY